MASITRRLYKARAQSDGELISNSEHIRHRPLRQQNQFLHLPLSHSTLSCRDHLELLFNTNTWICGTTSSDAMKTTSVRCSDHCTTLIYAFRSAVLILLCGTRSLEADSSTFLKIHQDSATGFRLCNSDTPQAVIRVKSKTQCAAWCNYEVLCFEFNYWIDSKRCELFFYLGGQNYSTNSFSCYHYRVSNVMLLFQGDAI